MTMPVHEQLAQLGKFSGGDFATDVSRALDSQSGAASHGGGVATALAPLTAASLATFQINVGKICNQACRHCHVDAGPKRTETMTRAIVDECLRVIRATPEIQTVDITGGAPEMNEFFRLLVTESRAAGKHVIDRCNLTILETPGQADLAGFLAQQQVEVIASLPHFAASRTDNQRGKGVFEASIRGLRQLNALGYGDTLPLHLVYNPTGLFLSSSQEQLEREFKRELETRHGVRFNNLYCINNLPISRFLESLIRADKFEDYMNVLHRAFNPATVAGLMCRHQVSVGYDGRLYDCDFNQMLNLKVASKVKHIKDYNEDLLQDRSNLP